jgi:[ribosomal protein S5]-alanine N-acetyltransferase
MIVDTERLLLRKLILSDAPFVLTLLNTPGWIRYIGDKNVRTLLDAQLYLKNGPVESYAKHGFGLWLVLLKDGYTPAGLCGILKRDELEHPDIGFAFMPEHTNKGYATEAVSATLRIASEHFEIPVLSAITTPDNFTSQKVLIRNGFAFLRIIRNPKGEELSLFFRRLTFSPGL